jgi:hypothetical protein
VEDYGPYTFKLGARVSVAKGFTGTVTAYDEASGFFTLDCGGGDKREVFLEHAHTGAKVVGAWR